MSQQIDWQYCKKCEGLFFAGNNQSVCPAGGSHDDSASGGYVLSDLGGGQPGWSWCGQCQGLFFTGNNSGVCPAHSDAGSLNYAVPTSGTGQLGWKYCDKCQGLFFNGSGPSVCAAGGGHDGRQSGLYFLPLSGTLTLPGWRFCNKCKGLFLAESPAEGSAGTAVNTLGVCPAGGAHDDGTSGNYVLPNRASSPAGGAATIARGSSTPAATSAFVRRRTRMRLPPAASTTCSPNRAPARSSGTGATNARDSSTNPTADPTAVCAR